MTTQEQYIERLKELTTAEFGRQILTHDDCIALSNAVLESVGMKVTHSGHGSVTRQSVEAGRELNSNNLEIHLTLRP